MTPAVQSLSDLTVYNLQQRLPQQMINYAIQHTLFCAIIYFIICVGSNQLDVIKFDLPI